MSRKIISVYLHLIWATWDREPWITPNIERQVYRLIVDQADKLGCRTLAINGMPDHIHLFVKFPTTISVSELIKKAKGVSSRVINQELVTGHTFRWQIGYGAFSVSRWDTDKIKNYVINQKKHHRTGHEIGQLERISITTEI